MALLTAPAPAPAPGSRPDNRVRPVGRLAARARSTPGRLTGLMVLLVALGLLAGTAAAVGIMQRSALVDGVRHDTGPLTVQAQELYRSLSDADATAASAFLSNGVEPAPLRQRYQDDIAAASAALAAVTAGTGTDRARVGRIAAQLPVYTGLVDTARTYNRLGIPLGAAYLREASGLMRADLLPAAQELYKQESDRLAGDLSGGAGFPWLAVPLLLITIAALVLAARYLTRRTQRLLNIGLVVATGAALLMLAWTTVSWLSVQGHLSRAQRAGADVVDELASARIAALNARADEALTLVARGSGGEFDKDFGDKMNQLGGRLGAARADAPGATGTAALTDVGKAMNAAGQAVADAQEHAKTWRDAHTKVRDQDNAGNYPEAVRLAVGDQSGGAAQAFASLDDNLAGGIAAANRVFDLEARAAADGFTLAVPGLVALTLLLLTGMVAGLQQRIAEYR